MHSIAKPGRVLSDPDAKVIVVEQWDQLTRSGWVGDMTEVLTTMCARLYVRHSARHRAMRALTAAERDPGVTA